MRNSVVSVCVVLTAALSDVQAQDSTGDLIRGTRVGNLVRIQRTSDATREQTGASFQFSLASGHLESLVAGMTMTATTEVRFAYKDFNPLEVVVVGSETSVPDPNFQQLSEFVTALLKIPGVIEGGQSGGLDESCKALQTVNQHFENLRNAMNASEPLPSAFNGWKDTINKAPGPTSIRSVQSSMNGNVETLRTSVQDARSILKSLQEFTERTADPTETVSDACKDAQALLRTLALAALSNPAYRERIDGLSQLATTLKELSDSLDRYATGDWDGAGFVFFTSRPSVELKKTITIKATPLAFRFTPTTLTRTQVDAKAVSTNFFLREYQSLVPELAAGMIVATARAPQYGTGTDAAGKTIVVRQTDKDVSFAGALLLNWVSSRPVHSSLQPLFQTGVSLSPDGPGILGGVGFRIGRPKRVAVTGGAILMWVKDLTDLREGGPVSGTAELKDDLEYQHTVKAYVAVQYQFRDPK